MFPQLGDDWVVELASMMLDWFPFLTVLSYETILLPGRLLVSNHDSSILHQVAHFHACLHFHAFISKRRAKMLQSLP